MPYNRDEVIASVTGFYDFLTTHLHFSPADLKTPPPTGWPQITPPRIERQRKSDTAVDLLRHLPYLPGGNSQEKWIYLQTVCADYTDKTVMQGVELDLDEIIDGCPWEKLKDPSRMEHIVALGVPEIGDGGFFIYLDTLDGEVTMWDVMQDDYLDFDSAGEFYSWLRKKYDELEIFPVPGWRGPPENVVSLTDECHQGYKDFVRSLGWPLGDGSKWPRDKAMEELQRVFPEYG